MNWIFSLTKRFRKKDRRGGVRFIWRLAYLGMGISVATLLITQSAVNGLREAIFKGISGFSAHLTVEKEELLPWKKEFFDLIQADQSKILASADFLHRGTLFVYRGKVKGGVIKGIDPLTFEKVYDVEMRTSLKKGQPISWDWVQTKSSEVPSILLGASLAAELGIERPGERIQLYLVKDPSDPSERGRFLPFNVEGFFDSGFYEFDHGFALVDIAQLQNYLSLPNAVSGREFKLKTPMKAQELAEAWKEQIGISYGQINSWQYIFGPLFDSLKVERAVFFVLMTMIVAIAAFNIIGVLLIMVLEKSKEISILRALGAPNRRIKQLFGLQGLWIGLIGCLGGIIGGIALVGFLNRFGRIALSKDLYFVEELSFKLSWTTIAIVLITSLLIAYMATQLALTMISKTKLDL